MKQLPLIKWGDFLAVALVMAVYLFTFGQTAVAAAESDGYLSPTALTATMDGKILFIACTTANKVLVFDTASEKVLTSIPMPESPSGLVLSADNRQLFVTCAGPESKVCIFDTKNQKMVGAISAGHTAMAPVLSPNGKMLYVCNRFNNDVSVIDLETKKELCRIAVEREPVAVDITKDGKFLLVANQLPVGPANSTYVAAMVSVIDTISQKVIKTLQLPNGSSSLNDIRVSPDGRYAAVTHLVGRFNRLPTRATEGWINANALTLIDLAEMKVHGTTLLDDHYRGAANPWGIAWSANSATLVVTHAGTHEISVIDFQKSLAQLPSLPANYDAVKVANLYAASKSNTDLPDDLPYFPGSRLRVKLADGDLGPRAVIVIGHTAYVANYFSDTLCAIDLNATLPKVKSIALGPKRKMNAVRKGELYFHDARICYEGWQSCASCHPGNARVDGLNWDLINDGIDNPKNTKSLLLAPKTPPVMSLGVRAGAKTAVLAGVQHVLFTSQSEEVVKEEVDTIEAYIEALKPVPSPFLVRGELSSAAVRGEKIFNQVGCVACHSSDLYTDLQPHDVGTRSASDKPTDRFYTPTLIEVWRTAPYLHDGSALTIREALTTRNSDGKHGALSNLSSQEIDDLCLYVLSL